MADSRGKMRPHHASRSPPFVLIGLLVVIAILAFNYWSASSSNNEILSENDNLKLKLRQSMSTVESHSKLIKDHEQANNELTDELGRLKEVQGKVLKDLETSNTLLEQTKGQLDSRQREIDDCLSEKTTLENDVRGCQSERESEQQQCADDKSDAEKDKAQELDAQRLDVLKVVQRIWGNTAIMVLRTAGVDTSGIDETAVIENVQDLPNAKKEPTQAPQQAVHDQPGVPPGNLPQGKVDEGLPQQPEGLPQQPEGLPQQPAGLPQQPAGLPQQPEAGVGGGDAPVGDNNVINPPEQLANQLPAQVDQGRAFEGVVEEGAGLDGAHEGKEPQQGVGENQQQINPPLEPENPANNPVQNPDQVPPNPDQAPPNPDQVPPNPDQVPPNPDQVPPNPDQVPPNPDQVPPNLDQAPPNPNQVPPNPDQVPPNLDQAPPNLDQAPPNPDQVPPNLYQALPNPDQVPPNPDQAPPNPDQVPPNPDQVPPNPDQVQELNRPAEGGMVEQKPEDGNEIIEQSYDAAVQNELAAEDRVAAVRSENGDYVQVHEDGKPVNRDEEERDGGDGVGGDRGQKDYNTYGDDKPLGAAAKEDDLEAEEDGVRAQGDNDLRFEQAENPVDVLREEEDRFAAAARLRDQEYDTEEEEEEEEEADARFQGAGAN